MPADWRVSEALVEWAKSALDNLDAKALESAFIDHWKADSTPKAIKRDWDAAFRTWCRNSERFGNAPRLAKPQMFPEGFCEIRKGRRWVVTGGQWVEQESGT